MLALGALKANDQIAAAFSSGAGMGWHEHDEDVFVGCEQFFRPGYVANLVPSWLPALDGVVDKLRAGARGADLGCGLGASTVLLGQAYPESRFTGSDYHERSIELARKRAVEAGVADRVQFEVAPAAGFSGSDYDLITTFDCLHDMGDPLTAAKHIRSALTADGTWMVVELRRRRRLRQYEPGRPGLLQLSTQLCVPSALSQPGGYSLGAQAERGGDPADRDRRGLHQVPPGHRDAVQHRL